MPVWNEDGTPDVEATYKRFEERMKTMDPEGALEDAQWFWEHALEHGPRYYGVRLSFFLSKFTQLALGFPDATAYIEGQRSELRACITRGDATRDTFWDLMRLNQYTNHDADTVTAFVTLETQQPELAADIGTRAWSDWVRIGALDVLRRHMPDAQRIIERTIEDLRHERDSKGEPEEHILRHLRGRSLRLIDAYEAIDRHDLADMVRADMPEEALPDADSATP